MRIAIICVEMVMMVALIASRIGYTRVVADPPFERWIGICLPPAGAVMIIVLVPFRFATAIFVAFVGSIILLDVVRIRRLRRRAKQPSAAK